MHFDMIFSTYDKSRVIYCVIVTGALRSAAIALLPISVGAGRRWPKRMGILTVRHSKEKLTLGL